MNEHHHENEKKYSLQDFYPLIIIVTIISGITIAAQIMYGYSLYFAMRIFMANFFLIFGAFKVINLPGFVDAYATYDLIAQTYKPYGYVYPFLEITLGIAYLANWNPTFTNAFTLVLMLISAAGVFNELRKGKQIVCACLGVVFKIPMTYVTLFEDLLMAAMALYMLL
jgi:Methylamine utilisation protein MauE